MTDTPAFPQVDLKDSYGMLVPDRQQGMSLRDYFAAKAMQGYIAYMGCGPDKVDSIGKDESEPNKTVIARCAYKFADAMIAEREK